jgi:hypothetical protein
MDLRLTTLNAVSFYLLQNFSALNQCRNLSCGTVTCKHFASYQGYPNYGWDITVQFKPEKDRYPVAPTLSHAIVRCWMFRMFCYVNALLAKECGQMACRSTSKGHFVKGLD